MKPRLPVAVLVLLTAAMSVIGLTAGDPRSTLLPIGTSSASARPAVLVDFQGCRALGRYLFNHRNEGYWGGPVIADDVALEGDASAGATSSAPVTNSETGTNVQEAGVDEPDTVKLTDFGVVALADGTLHAVETGTGAPVLADSLELGLDEGEGGLAADISYGGGAAQLLVEGARVVVIGSGWGEDGAVTTVTEVDASDPGALEIVRTTEYEGGYVSARQTGSTARIVLTAYPDVSALKSHRGAPARWLPSARTRDEIADEASRRPLVACNEVDRPRRFSGGGLLTVLTLDLSTGTEPIDSDAIVTSGDTVYASTGRLYVATQRWIWGEGDGDSTVPGSDVNTQIHAFSTTDPGTTEYIASGRVPGYMLSQWSMSEQDGFLRVASTTSPPWTGDEQQGESESIITVLGESGDALVKAGRLDGLGLGEQIYAVRFFGDVGFVVTFRQIDPLYALDLSDPAQPKLLGELKIPGYSAYLHPFGEERLLGLGQDADLEGRTKGTQLSLFDISDLSAPARLDIASFGRSSYSDVEWDHHAFFLDQDSGVAVIPITDWGGYNSRDDDFYGAVGVQVTPEGLAEITRIEHGRGWRAQITRTIESDGVLYTLSTRGLMSHDPATLAKTGWTAFPR